MPDTYTPNLNLKKPGYDSPADIADINANMDKIDTSVNQLSQQMGNYLLSDGTAADSSKLGGQLPSYYAKQEEVSQLSEQMANKLGKTEQAADSAKLGGVAASEFMKTTFNAGDNYTKAYDWNTIPAGMHYFNTWTGSGGSNYPEKGGSGILFVFAVPDMGVTFQLCFAYGWVGSRIKADGQWGAGGWKIVTAD